MYDLIDNVIEEGGYDLTDLLLKIDHAWLKNQITAGQRDALETKARNRAVPEYSYASDKQRILALEQTVRALELRVAALEATPGSGGSGSQESSEYPEWVKPSGALDCYNIGDRVRFNDKVYESLVNGNVWSPTEYPAAWQEVTEQEVTE